MQVLKNRRILITAGPTWVPIDSVRVISNIATGQTGILLAKELQRRRAKVTLLLGPTQSCGLDKKIRVLRFKFFDDLRSIVRKELRLKKYDIVIHSAAVADFKPVSLVKGKIESDNKYDLELIPLPKIIQNIRRLAPQAKLVMFKLELGVPDVILIQRAKIAQQKARADFVIANKVNPYRAFIINKTGNTIAVKSKNELVEKLVKLLVFTDITS